VSAFELLLSIAGFCITSLIGVVGYMVNRQFGKLDKIELDFLDTKSKMIEISNISRADKRAIIDHISDKIDNNQIQQELNGVQTQLVVLKEFQMKRIEPILIKTLIMSDKLEQQAKKQAESDEIISKMFEVVKRLVEKQNKS